MVKIKVLQIKGNKILIAGLGPDSGCSGPGAFTILDENRNEIPLTFFRMPYSDRVSDDGTREECFGFRAELPVHDGASYSFVSEGRKQKIKYGKKSRLQNLEGSYFEVEGHLIKAEGKKIGIYKSSFFRKLSARNLFEKTLKKEGKDYLIPLRRKAASEIKKGRPVVVIADRGTMARDNGEQLFKYLLSHGYQDHYDIYFALSSDSEDYERISKIGKVVDFSSDEYGLKVLTADKLITAGFDKFFTDTYGEDQKYLADIYHYEHHFLQHGVTMNDWSKYLNVTNKGFRSFCTVSGEEREFIIDRYGYTEDEVCLTGFARYDRPVSEPEKLIVFLPTWRKTLAGEADKKKGSRMRSDLIPGSRYQRAYNELINDPRLLEAMSERGYKGEFYVHPAHMENYDDFHGNDVVEVRKKADYNEIFSRAAIMVTDYSSVNVDFAYLQKPLIYYQFDKDEFFGEHLYDTGYFDYGRDGFGDIVEDKGSVVDGLIRYMDTGPSMDKKYIERVNKFFAFTDGRNTERVAGAIFRDK